MAKPSLANIAFLLFMSLIFAFIGFIYHDVYERSQESDRRWQQELAEMREQRAEAQRETTCATIASTRPSEHYGYGDFIRLDRARCVWQFGVPDYEQR